MSLPGYDAWLEKPYTDAAQREAEFERWCEANDEDPEDDTAWDRFDAFLNDQYDE